MRILCVSLCADIEEKGVTMKLTVIDTPGFGDQINNENWSVRSCDTFSLRALQTTVSSALTFHSSCCVAPSLVDPTLRFLLYGNTSFLCRSSSDICLVYQLAAHHEVHQRPVRGLLAGGDQHQQEEEDPRLQSPLLHILHPAHWALVRMHLVL